MIKYFYLTHRGTLTGNNALALSRLGINSIKGVFYIALRTRTGARQSDFLIVIPRTLAEGFYLSTEV